MATIKDVAKLAGVSFKTVSRVINRGPNVRDEVRQKVLRAADTLEYRPLHHVRQMRTQRSKVIAFLSDNIATAPFAGQIIQGAQEAAWQREMLLLTFNTDGDPAMEAAAVEVALERGVEGIIFAAMYHRPVQVPNAAFRLPDDGYEHALALLRRKQIPTAIFCANDRIAMGVYDALKEKGFRIPEDVSVVGFDNQELLAAHSRPPLTTVRIPYFEMGSWGINQLIDAKPDGNPSADGPVTLECPLVLRASVDRPPSAENWNRRIRSAM